MRFLLDIVIPKDELEKVDLEEQLIEWGGVKFSQEPAKYVGKEVLVFEELANLKFHSDLLGEALDEEKYKALIFKGDEVSEVEFLANSRREELENNSLFAFLKSLITLSKFYLFLLREDEVIKEQYAIEGEEDFKDVLCRCLSWTEPKDIVIVKK